MTTPSPPRLTTANASFVTSQLLVGGDLDPNAEVAERQLVELGTVGVTHVIDVRQEWSDELFVTAMDPTMNYLHHGVDDAGQTIPGEWFDVGVEFALAALADPDSVVLAHCHMGINRGPSLGFAVLLAQGWQPVAAIDAIRRARPIAFAAYAEDALAWHHDRTGASDAQRATDIADLSGWRAEHNLDASRVIRRIRQQESGW